MRTFEELETMVDGIRDAPAEAGVVVLIVRRPAVDEREVVDEARLDVAEGLVGDTWRVRGNRHTPDGSGDPAAQLMYQDAAGARYTLFATRGPGDETPVRAVERDGIGALYWTDREMAYAIIGSAPRDRLEAITRVVHAQLEGEPS